MHAELQLTGRRVRPITRDTFPIGQTVVVQAFIDTCCGWEYDAPLHFMEPFHRYIIVSSSGPGVIIEEIEAMLDTLYYDGKIEACADTWPYDAKYLKRVWPSIRRGRRDNRFWYYRAEVTVNHWGGDESNGSWTIDVGERCLKRT